MLMQIAPTVYELAAYETVSASKTFRLAQKTVGHWEVTSHNTSNPTCRYFWGCKTFRNLSEVEKNYKVFRGVAILLQVAA